MSSMITIPMKDNRAAFVPDTWAILNESDAINCTHCCVLDVPKAAEEGAPQQYLFFSNAHCNSFTAEQKQEVFYLAELEWPHLLEVLMKEPKALSKADALRYGLLFGAAKLEQSGLGFFAEKFEKIARTESDESIIEHTEMIRQLTGSRYDDIFSDPDQYQQVMAYIADKNIDRHGFFEIYPEGQYPNGGNPPFGAVIKRVGEEGCY